MQRYGEGRIFRDRLAMLRTKAETYFIARQNQELEGTFNCLTKAAEGFSDRRNEVAHGMVFPIHTVTFFRSKFAPDIGTKEQYAIIPPYYLLRKHDATGAPMYAYTYRELRILEEKLLTLSEKLGEFRVALLSPPTPSLRYFAPPLPTFCVLENHESKR